MAGRSLFGGVRSNTHLVSSVLGDAIADTEFLASRGIRTQSFAACSSENSPWISDLHNYNPCIVKSGIYPAAPVLSALRSYHTEP